MTSWLDDSLLQLIHRQIAQEMEALAWICESESLLDLDSLNSSKSILSFFCGRSDHLGTTAPPHCTPHCSTTLLHHTAIDVNGTPWGYATKKCKLPPCPTLLRPALLLWLEGNSSQVLCYSPWPSGWCSWSYPKVSLPLILWRSLAS